MSAVTVHHGDMRDVLATLDADSVHSVVTDPPYHLSEPPHVAAGGFGGKRQEGQRARRAGFMGKSWDGGDVAFQPDTWRAVWRVMKPGAYLVAFASTRGYHRMVCAIEDAGFIIHPMLGWITGQGFPKATDASRMIDKHLGATREVVGVNQAAVRNKQRNTVWTGDVWGDNGATLTAPATPEAQRWAGWAYGLQSLKPALEPICMAQKPAERGGMVRNILMHGAGAINVDASRVPASDGVPKFIRHGGPAANCYGDGLNLSNRTGEMDTTTGRWPANVLHDGSPEVEAAFAAFGTSESTDRPRVNNVSLGSASGGIYGKAGGFVGGGHADTGTAARFFASCPPSPDELRFHYSGKADAADRADSRHPTIKPLSLMRWLVRLITPPGGTVLDPFAGAGGVAEACMVEGFDCILVEKEAEHVADIRHRIKRWSGADLPLFSSWPPAEDPDDARLADLFREAAD